MRVLEYKVIDSDNEYEVGQINQVVLLEDTQDYAMNSMYVKQGCNNNTEQGKAWNEYLLDKVGLTDEDVFYFMSSGEEKDEWVMDGIKMELVKE